MEPIIFGPSSYGSQFIPESENLKEGEIRNLYDGTKITVRSDPVKTEWTEEKEKIAQKFEAGKIPARKIGPGPGSALIDVSQSWESDEANQFAEDEEADNAAFVGSLEGPGGAYLLQKQRNFFGISVAPYPWGTSPCPVPSEAYWPSAREVLAYWYRTIKDIYPWSFGLALERPTYAEYDEGIGLSEPNSDWTDDEIIQGNDNALFYQSDDAEKPQEMIGLVGFSLV